MPSPQREYKHIREDLKNRVPGTVAEWAAKNHGVEGAQYFQGCGTAFTRWDDVAVGHGNTSLEAYDDAVEQLAMSGWKVHLLPKRPRGFSNKSELPKDLDEDSELYHYACVYVKGVAPR